MPVITNLRKPNPYGPDFSHSAIGMTRARHQDIREIEILVVNLMADKKTTAKLLANWLGDTPLQVNLTFAATDSWMRSIENGRESANTDVEYIKQFIHPFEAISHRKFDGFVLTGFNARKDRVEQEDLYPEVTQIIDHMETHATSSLYLCYGAKAALKHLHDIDSHKKYEIDPADGQLKEAKRFGVFDFTKGPFPDETGILRGLPDSFPIPVARWKSPDPEALANHRFLNIVATSAESGPGIIVETAPYDDGKKKYVKKLYVLPHPEYDPQAMHEEYLRDHANGLLIPFPKRLYRSNGNGVDHPANSWAHTGRLYTNWVNDTYDATPRDISLVPQPFLRPRLVGAGYAQPQAERGAIHG